MIETKSIAPPEPGNVNIDNHPCFNKSACNSHGRIHLPVAPKCNIQCNYCNRKHDCVNESRPGVCSATLSPGQALAYLDKAMALRGDIAVVGIAGPGDPLANSEATLETFRLIRNKYPKMLLCLSTNGLGLTPEIAEELARLQVSHVTITINAVDPDIAGKIYAWARWEKRIRRNRQAGELMIERQLAALAEIKRRGIIAKVNSIILPGVNDTHIPEIARVVGEMGADVMNCIPLIPTEDTPFEELPEPDAKMRFAVRLKCSEHVGQMTHCARCRADAVGKLGEKANEELREIMEDCARLPLNPQEERPHVAVATREGMLVNQHLGEARAFAVFAQSESDPNEFVHIETRDAPEPGGRDSRWSALGSALSDCRAILVSAAGSSPRRALSEAGLQVIEMEGMIDAGLRSMFLGEPLPPSMRRSFSGCGKGVTCGGDGTGCG